MLSNFFLSFELSVVQNGFVRVASVLFQNLKKRCPNWAVALAFGPWRKIFHDDSILAWDMSSKEGWAAPAQAIENGRGVSRCCTRFAGHGYLAQW